jgi:hypothetical protein
MEFGKYKEDISKCLEYMKLRLEAAEKEHNQYIAKFYSILQDYLFVEPGDLIKLTPKKGTGWLVLLIEDLIDKDKLKAHAKVLGCGGFDTEVMDKFKQGTMITYDVIEILALDFKIEKVSDELAKTLYGRD